MRDLFLELKNRKVIKVGIAYLVGAWLVLQLADVVFPAIGLSDKAVTLVFGILAVGFPLALILSWVFDVTSAGIKRSEDIEETGERSDRSPSIAVIPFPDVSAEQDQEHFCDGLTEELLNVLTCIPGLRVASRTSTFSLKGKQVDLKEVAKKFDVEHILEGSVRKSGNRIRVTAQLIEAATDSHVWSENYDRELDDIFAIQDDIAACILEKLKLELGPARAADASTKNAKAYEYFLRGRGYALARGDHDVDLAATMFEKAVAIDPDFVSSWILLAEMCAVYAMFYERGDSRQRNNEWQDRSRQASDALSRLLPEKAESFLASGYSHLTCDDFDAAARDFEKTIQLDPTIATAHNHLGRALLHLGKLEAAARSFAQATALDEEDFESPFLATSIYEGLGDDDNAKRHARIGLERAERTLADYPDNQRAYYLGSGGLAMLGEKARANEWIERALEMNPDDLGTRYNAACFYAMQGDIEKALDCLENSITSRAWIENDADLNALHGHPRYQAVLDALPDLPAT